MARLLPLMALALFVSFAAGVKEVTKLQIGVKHKPSDCTLKAKAGDSVSVHYEGKLTDGTVFDSSYERGDPISFGLGQGQVLWEGYLVNTQQLPNIFLPLLKHFCARSVGEKRKLKIPSHLGYGAQGSPPKIPGGATLIFETELVSIES